MVGQPAGIRLSDLNGMFRVETGSGQFVKLDPGLGKLLGVLSLQALKRRFTFDFQDLFGEGFCLRRDHRRRARSGWCDEER